MKPPKLTAAYLIFHLSDLFIAFIDPILLELINRQLNVKPPLVRIVKFDGIEFPANAFHCVMMLDMEMFAEVKTS